MNFRSLFIFGLLLFAAAAAAGCLPPTTTGVEPPVPTPTAAEAAPTVAEPESTAEPTEPSPTVEPTETNQPVPTATVEPTQPAGEPAASASLAGLIFRRFNDATYQFNSQLEITHLGGENLIISPGVTRGAFVDFSDAANPLVVVDLLNPNIPSVTLPMTADVRGCFAWQNENIILCSAMLPDTPEGPHLGHIARVDVNTGRSEILVNDRFSFSPPSVSADGGKIAFDVGDNQLMMWENGSVTSFDFAAYEDGIFVPTQGIGSPSLSPDGTQLAVVFGGSPARYIVFDLMAGTARELTAFEPLGFGGYFPAAQWSPAGDRLALHLLTADPADQRIIVVGNDGTLLLDTATNSANPIWLTNDDLLGQTLVDGNPQENIVWNVSTGSQAAIELPEGAFPVRVGPTSPLAIRLDEVYVDGFAGMTVNYPADWTVIEVPGDVKEQSGIYAVTFNQFDPNAMVGGGEGIPLGTSKFDFVVYAGSFPDLEAVINERRFSFEQSDFPSELLVEERVTLPSGLEAYYRRIYSSFGGQVTEYATVHDGRMIIISGFGNPRLVDEVAATLRRFGD